MELKITAADLDEEMLFYSDSGSSQEEACVGHLRMDFDRNGSDFHSSWFVHNGNLKVFDFISDLQDVLYEMRQGMLKSRSSLQNYLEENPALSLGDRGSGLKVETDDYVYFFRCRPTSGDYDCYCYCYDKELLEQAMAEEENMEMGGISQ